jgi:predicted homoserine dehydrogenase-like protein
VAVCQDGNLIAQCELVDVFMEATNSIGEAAEFIITALQHNKHVANMNYETDLMFSPHFMKLAEEKGLVYSACDGDQPTSTKAVIDEMEFMGFKLVMAGNIKGYLDRYVDPTTIIPEADKRDLDYRMCSAYTDGSKLCVEQAVIANALGLRTAVPGMYGPRMARVEDIFDHFDFEALWDGENAIVDYVLGATPKGGVYAVGYCDHFHQMKTMAYLPSENGKGPFYVFAKPYHLGHFESMATVARAFLDKQAVLIPKYGMNTNVYAYAKRDLKAGDTLDGLGGYACYGLIENLDEDAAAPGIPICLAEKVTLKKDVRKDEKVMLEDVDYDPNSFTFKLYDQSIKAV